MAEPSTNDRTTIRELVESIEGVEKHVREEAIAACEQEKTLRIMACGLSGVGKSTLLNGIAGQDGVFKEGQHFPETFEVSKHSVRKDNYTLILYDTPGFQDDIGKEEEYLKQIKEECPDPDTLLYCISVKPARIKMKEDLLTLKMLKATLNEGIWKNCVVVLTFANSIVSELKDKGKEDIKGEFDKNIKAWEKEIFETFVSAGIDPFVNKIPFIYAGIATKQFLYEKNSCMPKDDDECEVDGEHPNKLEEDSTPNEDSAPEHPNCLVEDLSPNELEEDSTPEHPDKPAMLEVPQYASTPWLSILWDAVYTKSPQTGQPVLFFHSLERLRTVRTVVDVNSDSSSLASQLIVPTPSTHDRIRKQLKDRFPTIAAAVATGGTAGVAGAGIGATIGALAIGIPTFGTAAGVGLVLGGLIGGAAGVGVGAATGTIFERVRNRNN